MAGGRVHGSGVGPGRRRVDGRVLLLSLAILTLLLPGSTIAVEEDWDNPNWDHQVVDSFGGLSSNTGLSVAVDSRGRPHVAYYALEGADLRYAVLDGTSWSVETVDDHQVVGPDCSIALDGDDRPHICCYDKTNEELEYARWNGTGWELETVDQLGIVGVGTSIALGPDGTVHMVYVGANTLRCAVRDGDGWNVTVVDGGEKAVYTPSVTVDGEGVPHVLYIGPGTVKHAFVNEGRWVLEVVDTLRGVTVAMRTSIEVDQDGDLVACYANDAGTSVVIARRGDDGWSRRTVSRGHYLGDLDMELDEDGEPHVALMDMAFDGERVLVNTDVWYLEREGGTWTRGVVSNSSGHHGVHLSLHLDGDGGPSIALVDIDPTNIEANLTYLTGWTGAFIEAYTGEGTDGDDGDGGIGPFEEDHGPSLTAMAPAAVAITVLVLVVVVLVLRNEGRGGA